MTITTINNGAAGNMKGVNVTEGGNRIEIIIPNYNKNAFGIESTISQIQIDGRYDLSLSLDDSILDMDCRIEKWFEQLMVEGERPEVLIKMMDLEENEVATYCCTLIPMESKQSILTLTKLN